MAPLRHDTVVFEKSETGWAAYVPDITGVIASGRTKQEVQQRIREAIEFHLDGRKEDNLRFQSQQHRRSRP